MQNGKNYTGIITAAVIVIIVVGAILLIVLSKKTEKTDDQTARTNREVAMICTTDMATQFHVHPELEIIINGEKQVIPTNIGIVPGCMNPLHTHDDTGKIHVESPVKRDFTLDDFFAVWGKTFTKDQILDHKVDDAHIIRETVNGIEVPDFQNTVLRDLDKIVISYELKGEEK